MMNTIYINNIKKWTLIIEIFIRVCNKFYIQDR